MKIRFLMHMLFVVCFMASVSFMPNLQATPSAVEHVRVSEPAGAGHLFFLGAAIVAVTGFFVWLFSSPSDESVLNAAQNEVDRTNSRYGALARYLASTYPEQLPPDVTTVNETVLEELATKQGVCAGMYLSLQDAFKKFEKVHASLEKRMRRLVSCVDKKSMYEHMRELAEEMDILAQMLNFTRRYTKEHNSYFKARERVFAISSKYKEVYRLAMVKTGEDLQEALHSVVMDYGQQHNDAYPYVQYVDTLAVSLSDVREQYNPRNFLHEYPCLMKDIQEVAQALENAKKALLAGDTYRKQKAEKERALREQERLELERREAYALEQQAAAQAAQAQASMISAMAHIAHACCDDGHHHHDACGHIHGHNCACSHCHG